MKKQFTLLTKTLLVAVCLLVGASSAWGTDVTASWLAPSSTMDLTGNTTSASLLSVSNGTYSSALKHVTVWGKNSTYYYTFDRNDETQDTKGTINESRYVDFVATVPTGYRFTLSKIEAVGIGVGTGNNSWRVDYYKPGASTGTTIAPAAQLGSGTESSASIEPSTDNVYEEGQTIKVRVYIGINNTTENKDVGLRDIKIIGASEVASTDPAPASITTQPSNIDAHVGVEATLSVEAAGYPAPTFQWYSCDDTEKTNATPIDGATSASYSFTPAAAGNLYFYVTAQNVYNTEPAVSNVATVTVTPAKAEAPSFTVYGNTVQLASATDGATIYYELDNPDVKTSGTKVAYSGAFIPASSGTIYAYAEKAGFTASDVTSKAVTLSTVGDVVGGKLVTMQPTTKDGSKYDAKTYSNNGFTLVSTAELEASGRGAYTYHFKTSGTITVTAPSSKIIQSIKIIGTSNDGSKVSTITAGDGATVISTPAELMQRDVKVGDDQTMTEIVVTVDEPSAGNSVSFTLGRESRFYVEVYGPASATIGSTGYTTFASSYPLNISGMTASTGTVKAYYVTASDVKSSSVALTELTGNVAAGTGLILEGTAGATITIPVVASGTDYTSTNMLVGCTANTDITASTENYGNFYVLSATEAAFKKIKNWVDAPNTLTIPAGKAYLDTTGAGVVGAPSLTFDLGGEATGIADVRGKMEDVRGDFFDLQGRKVAQPTKGLYILNGKKMVIK